MPKTGDLVVDMPPGEGVKGIDEPAVLYTNNGTDDSPAVLGRVTIDPKYIAARDGFFTFPTQTLLKVTADAGRAGPPRSSPVRTSRPTPRLSTPR